MSLFDTVHTTYCWRSIVTMALSRVVSEIFNAENVVTLKSRSDATQDHRKWCHLIECQWFPIKSSILTLSVKMHRFFLDIRVVTIQWPWKPGYGSLKVIGIDTDRFATNNFLLTFRCNRGPISYRFRDIRQFQSKIANFSQPPSTLRPAEVVPLGIGYQCWGSKN